MRKSVFDSKSEETVFKRLKTAWQKYVDVFPQLPPTNVFGYNEIKSMENNQGAKDFLLQTSFDFVVCEIVTHSPLLVIEFDGMCGGFSREGE